MGFFVCVFWGVFTQNHELKVCTQRKKKSKATTMADPAPKVVKKVVKKVKAVAPKNVRRSSRSPATEGRETPPTDGEGESKQINVKKFAEDLNAVEVCLDSYFCIFF